MKKQELIKRNEEIANRVSTKILLASTLAYPILILLGLFNIYEFDMNKLYVYCVIGTFCTVTPYILRKIGVNSRFLKYYALTMSVIAIAILSANYQVGIHLLLMFPIAMSCIYYDIKLTIIALIMQITSIFSSNYVRVFSTPYYSSNPMGFYVSTTIGYIIELSILSMIFIWLTKRIRTLIGRTIDSEDQLILYIDKLKGIMNSSKNASETLSNSVKQLLQAVEQATASNDNINQNADSASSGCEKNLQYIESANATVANISDTLESISSETQRLYDISQSTLAATEENEKLVNQTIKYMEEIEMSFMQNKDIINSLSDKTKEIGLIIGLITNVTKQTNLLAINAAIESSRSNEQGKGFTVIADEIRKLAEKCASAAKNISVILNQIQEDTEKAVSCMDQSYVTIQSGIELAKNVGESFENLKNLQDISNQEIQNIAQNSIQTSNYGRKITEVMSNTKSNTAKSLDELKSIASDTSIQSSVMQEILSSFNIIDNIADELLNLSTSIDLQNTLFV